MGASNGKFMVVEVGSRKLLVQDHLVDARFSQLFRCQELISGDSPESGKASGEIFTLKRILCPATDDPFVHAVVQHETDVYKRVGIHPNLVNCFGIKKVSHEDGDIEVLLLLENCKNGSLKSTMKAYSYSPLSTKEAIFVFSQIVDAVAFLHSASPPVFHWDIYPGNIYIHRSGSVKLAELGSGHSGGHVGVQSNSSEKEAMILQDRFQRSNELSYRAPEMLDVGMYKKIGPEADIWALGCLLYNLLYGKNCFVSKTQALSGIVPFPDSDEHPQIMKQFLLKLLETNPAKRPSIEQVKKMIQLVVQEILNGDAGDNMDSNSSSDFFSEHLGHITGAVSKRHSRISGKVQNAFALELNHVFQKLLSFSDSSSDFHFNSNGMEITEDAEKPSYAPILKPSNYKEIDNHILKALTPELVAPKHKHVRKLIIILWESESAEYIFHCIFKYPVHRKPVIAFKGLQIMHKILLEGPPECLPDSFQYRSQLKTSIYDIWKERKTSDNLACIICEYTRFLDQKIKYHSEFPMFEGNLSVGKYLKDLQDRGFEGITQETLSEYFITLIAALKPLLRIGRLVIEIGFLSCNVENTISREVEIEFHQTVLILLLDELSGLYHASTFFLSLLGEIKWSKKAENFEFISSSYREFYFSYFKLIEKVRNIPFLQEMNRIPHLPRSLAKLNFQSMTYPLPSNTSTIGIANSAIVDEFKRHLVIVSSFSDSNLSPERKVRKSSETRRLSDQKYKTPQAKLSVHDINVKEEKRGRSMTDQNKNLRKEGIDLFEGMFKDADALKKDTTFENPQHRPYRKSSEVQDKSKATLQNNSNQLSCTTPEDQLTADIRKVRQGLLRIEVHGHKDSRAITDKKTSVDTRQRQSTSPKSKHIAVVKPGEVSISAGASPRRKQSPFDFGPWKAEPAFDLIADQNDTHEEVALDPFIENELVLPIQKDRSLNNEPDFDIPKPVKTSRFQIVRDDEIDFEEIEMKERIGIGGFAEVFKGEWRGTDVAIKKLLPHKQTKESISEFEAEIEMMRRLRHPNIVMYMGCCLKASSLGLVTELLQMSLFDLLHNTKVKLNWKLRFKIAIDTATGMNFLHLSKPVIIHRDLKSANLLLDKHYGVKISDFGLSRVKAQQYTMTAQVGTFQWMAPEVISSGNYTEKADVYSFGIILWEMIARKIPFYGMNGVQCSVAVSTQGLRPEIPMNTPPDIAKLIRTCWDVDPDLRPSFDQIVKELKTIRNNLITIPDSI